MKRIAQILLTKSTGQIEAGEIIFDAGKLSYIARPGHERLMGTIRHDPIPTKDALLVPGVDPEKWFNALPVQYNGSYVRARILSAA